jgi:hypothetical protein
MKGRIPQARSRAAILGHLAATAAGETGDQKVASWLEEKGIDVGLRGLRDALAARLARSTSATTTANDPTETGWIRKSLDFDATKLDLNLAIVVFPASDQTSNLRAVLRSTERVVRIYQGYDRALVAIVAYDGAKEHRDLRTRLEELEPNLDWILVREVDDAPAADTWLALARRAASTEGLLM